MKKITLSFLLLMISTFCFDFVYAQVEFKEQRSKNQSKNNLQTATTTLNCNEVVPNPSSCGNYIQNIDFSATPIPSDETPFNDGSVPNWNSSHGTAQLYDIYYGLLTGGATRSAPQGVDGYAFMAFQTQTEGDIGEGITQHISPLNNGEKYALSFYKAISYFQSNDPNYNATHKITFKIVLLNCIDFPPMNSPNNEPQIPINAQTIYCEINPENIEWEQVFVNFTANSNYNMIWIFPSYVNNELAETITPNEGGISFAYPELININNFTAGPDPDPQATNCIVTIGPSTPICGIHNSVYNWYGPQDQIIPATSNQQLTLNANVDYGIWTLVLEVPSSVYPLGLCSGNGGTVKSSVFVRQCNPPLVGIWPKAYGGKAPSNLIVTTNHNVILDWAGPIYSFTPNLNHAGPLSTITNGANYLFQYTPNGVTNWVTNEGYDPFPMQNGDLNFWYSTNIFYESNSGNSIVPPLIISNNEKLIGETNDGNFLTSGYITNNYSNPSLRLRNGNSVLSTFPETGYSIKKYFNRNTNTIYSIVIEDYTTKMKQYSIANSTISLISSNILGFNVYQKWLQITNTGKTYFVINEQVQEYDYTNSTFSPIMISGLTNANLSICRSSNPYTENKAMVVDNLNNQLIVLDFSDPTNITSKKIEINNFPNGFSVNYAFDSNDVYISGSFDQSAQIGNQNIVLNTYSSNIFLTKLNLLTDFSKSVNQKNNSQLSNFEFTISPNPSKDYITLNIYNDKKNNQKFYNIKIFNKLTNSTLIHKNYQSGEVLYISNLQKGLYFIEVTDKNGNNKIEKFIKL